MNGSQLETHGTTEDNNSVLAKEAEQKLPQKPLLRVRVHIF